MVSWLHSENQTSTEFEGGVVTATNVTLTLDDGTVVEQESDLPFFTAIASAVAAGRMVEVEGEGMVQADASILAFEAEVDDDDND